MIITPLGKFYIIRGDEQIVYEEEKLADTVRGYNLDARYKLFVPVFKASAVSLIFESEADSVECSNDQDLEVAEFYKGDTKICIGVDGDVPGIEYEVLKNGIRMIVDNSCERKLIACIVDWKEKAAGEEDDFGCWLAADPNY